MGFNSTIRLKEKICVNCGKPCFWFSRKRCKDCARVEDFHEKEAKYTQDETGLPELIDRLDGLVSKWVRFSARDKDFLVECYTCGDKRMAHVMDAGHYISRNCMYLRFDVARNLRPQCPTCNRAKYGMAAAFGKHLELDLPGVTEILLEESRIVYKWTRDELHALISEYTQKIKSLK